MSPQFVEKNKIFLDTSKQGSKKGECVFLKKKRMKKKTKKGVSQKKRETIFKTQKKETKHGKTKCRKVPNKKRKQTKLFLR